MEVNSRTILQIFLSGGDVHYILPRFQREYAWEEANWKSLLNDILSLYNLYDSTTQPEHFMGALVVIGDGTRGGTIGTFKLVDGQQRLTSISILLCSLAMLIQDSHPKLSKTIRRLLLNEDEQGDLRFKLLPTPKYTDRVTYQDILTNQKVTIKSESKIADAFYYFTVELEKQLKIKHLSPEQLFTVIGQHLRVVLINIDPREKPYEIFESLNAKGKPLTQADLVRNYIAMRVPSVEQNEMFYDWEEIETRLRENRMVGRIGELTAFLRHYLGLQMRALPNKDQVYARFRDRMEQDFKDQPAFTEELKTLRRFAEYYDCFLRPEQLRDIDYDIYYALSRLNILEASTAYPLLLALMNDYYHNQFVNKTDFLAALAVIENYTMRRFITGEQTNYVNKMYPLLYKEIDVSNYVSSLKEALCRRNYPSDRGVRDAVLSTSLYERTKPQRVGIVLESVNRHLSRGTGGYTVLDGHATIEHIMPQTLSPEWKRQLGENWKTIHEDHLHTLGNLTLVTQEWNSQLSNASFSQKFPKLAQNALRLNHDFFGTMQELIWNDMTIQARAEFIAENIVQIWPSFGETTHNEGYKGQTPAAITFLDKLYPVQSWRDVWLKTVELIMQHDLDRFAEIARDFTQISHQERQRSRQMGDWWIYFSLSAESVVALCERLVAAIGLDDDSWNVDVA